MLRDWAASDAQNRYDPTMIRLPKNWKNVTEQERVRSDGRRMAKDNKRSGRHTFSRGANMSEEIRHIRCKMREKPKQQKHRPARGELMMIESQRIAETAASLSEPSILVQAIGCALVMS